MAALRAPMAVPVEIRAELGTRSSKQVVRVVRLARAVGEDGVRLERAAPIEVGRPVHVAFALPGSDEPIVANARIAAAAEDRDDSAGRELAFGELPSEARARIGRYVAERLGLPRGL
jgi:hypothetical protein